MRIGIEPLGVLVKTSKGNRIDKYSEPVEGIKFFLKDLDNLFGMKPLYIVSTVCEEDREVLKKWIEKNCSDHFFLSQTHFIDSDIDKSEVDGRKIDIFIDSSLQSLLLMRELESGKRILKILFRPSKISRMQTKFILEQNIRIVWDLPEITGILIEHFEK